MTLAADPQLRLIDSDGHILEGLTLEQKRAITSERALARYGIA